MIGSARGRKPRVVETMKAGRVMSSGLVSLRTSNCEIGPTEPMTDDAQGDILEKNWFGMAGKISENILM